MAFNQYIAVVALLALGCGGKAFDLGHADPQGFADVSGLEATASKPQTIYKDDNDVVFGFTVDETNLYALIMRGDPYDTYELVSCPLERCQSERKVLYSGPAPHGGGYSLEQLALVGDTLLWTTLEGLASCSKEGCADLQLTSGLVQSFAGDDHYAYWLDGSGVMRLASGSTEPEQLRHDESQAPVRSIVATSDNYIYATDTSRSAIYRIAKDGQSDFQLLATDQTISSVAVSEDALYYSTKLLTGRIAKCPLTDCASGASDVSARERWPTELRVASGSLFWLNELATQQTTSASISSCVLPECASVKRWELKISSFQQENERRLPVNSSYIVFKDQFSGGSWLKLVRR